MYIHVVILDMYTVIKIVWEKIMSVARLFLAANIFSKNQYMYHNSPKLLDTKKYCCDNPKSQTN